MRHESDFGTFNRSAFVTEKTFQGSLICPKPVDMLLLHHRRSRYGWFRRCWQRSTPPSQALAAANAASAAAVLQDIALNRRPRATAPRRTAAIPSKWKAARLEAAYQDAQREYQEQQGYEGQQGYDQNAYATYDQQQQGGFYNQNTYAQGYNQQAYAQQGYDQTQYDYSYQ